MEADTTMSPGDVIRSDERNDKIKVGHKRRWRRYKYEPEPPPKKGTAKTNQPKHFRLDLEHEDVGLYFSVVPKHGVPEPDYAYIFVEARRVVEEWRHSFELQDAKLERVKAKYAQSEKALTNMIEQSKRERALDYQWFDKLKEAVIKQSQDRRQKGRELNAAILQLAETEKEMEHLRDDLLHTEYRLDLALTVARQKEEELSKLRGAVQKATTLENELKNTREELQLLIVALLRRHQKRPGAFQQQGEVPISILTYLLDCVVDTPPAAITSHQTLKALIREVPILELYSFVRQLASMKSSCTEAIKLVHESLKQEKKDELERLALQKVQTEPSASSTSSKFKTPTLDGDEAKASSSQASRASGSRSHNSDQWSPDDRKAIELIMAEFRDLEKWLPRSRREDPE
ncbi:unnamed protein product, partial [Mesorhabditis spiculigera]